MLRRILLAIAAVILIFAAYVAVQPSTLRISRSTLIEAPPEAVLAHVEDFRKWQAWSPWANLDPNAKATFEGPAAGKGAVFKWSGNDEVGEGRMSIVETRPGEHVGIKLDFTKPFENSSDVAFDVKPEGGKSRVTWSMQGEQGFLMRAMCILMNGEGMMNAQYDKGLASLKKVVEQKG